MVGPFRPPLSASFRIYFGIFFFYSRSLLRILKQVQDDNLFLGPDVIPLRLLWSVHSDLHGPRHSEFSSESFTFTLGPFLWILKQVQDDIFFWEGEASHEELHPQTFYPRSLLFNARLSILYFLYPREQLVPTLVFNLYPTGHLITHLRRLLSYLINEELWQLQELVDVL